MFCRSSRVRAQHEGKASVSKRNHSTTQPPLIPQPPDVIKSNGTLAKPVHIADLLSGDGDESPSSNTPSDPSTGFSPVFRQATPIHLTHSRFLKGSPQEQNHAHHLPSCRIRFIQIQMEFCQVHTPRKLNKMEISNACRHKGEAYLQMRMISQQGVVWQSSSQI